MASFQVLQNSRVLICYDDRFKDTPPKWLQARNFRLQEGMTLPAAPEGSGHGYCIFAKNVREGTEVKQTHCLKNTLTVVGFAGVETVFL